MKHIFMLNLLISTFFAFGQKVDSLTRGDEVIITYVEVAANFPGGQDALNNYIEKNFAWTQRQEIVQGNVFVEFWIEKNGEIKDAKVIRGLCDTCDKEALRLVTQMPKWTPAKQKEKPIRTRMVLPIKFGP